MLNLSTTPEISDNSSNTKWNYWIYLFRALYDPTLFSVTSFITIHQNVKKMKPVISSKNGGQLLIDNKVIRYDFYINSKGEVKKRKLESTGIDKNNILTLSEANEVFQPDINELIIGCPKDDKLMLSNEATDFFEEKMCKVKLLPLSEAITYWNRYEGHAVGLFHVTQ